ncbi:HEPN domain-containing protein [Vibrio cyclitrophicus]
MAHYSLRVPYENFINEVTELENIVTTLASQDSSTQRDTHIEGCFIRLVVAWECFIEEYFLRCMCGGKKRTSGLIKPHVTLFKNTNEAFTKINKHRRSRDKDFTDWLDGKQIKIRCDDFFRSNSRVHNMYESPDKLYELTVIRNAIAHRSKSAVIKFEKYVKDQIGYLAPMNPTMASLLVQKKRGNNKVIFCILSEYFLDLATRLTK